MNEWIRSALDLILIVMVGAGLTQAVRLIRHLSGLKQGRIDMERFVHEFNAAVSRADNGIKNLRASARESGDDLEKLVEKAVMVRDELHFIVESADQLAERLTQAAAAVIRPEAKPAVLKSVETAPETSPTAATRKTEPSASQPSSRAEKELLQALQKMK